MTLNAVEQAIAEKVVASIKDGSTKEEVRELVKKEVLIANYLKGDQQISDAVERITNEFTTEPEDDRSIWDKLSITARIVFLLMMALGVLSNISQSGVLLGVIKGVVGVSFFIVCFGLPVAYLVSLVTKQKEKLFSNAVIFSGVLELVFTVGLILLVTRAVL